MIFHMNSVLIHTIQKKHQMEEHYKYIQKSNVILKLISYKTIKKSFENWLKVFNLGFKILSTHKIVDYLLSHLILKT